MSFAAGTSAEPTPTGSPGFHPEWASVGEALATRSWAVVERCRVVGRDLAEQGVSAGEALEELRSTTQRWYRRDPDFEECQALVESWADATLGYLNRLSCTDPLTGLDSQAHLVTLLGIPDLAHLDDRTPAVPLALVVIEVPRPDDFFDLARRLSSLGSLARAVFPKARATSRVGVRRLAVLTPAAADLGTRAALLERGAGGQGRVWIEAIDAEVDPVALVDRLARD
jgi:hypothetical protein